MKQLLQAADFKSHEKASSCKLSTFYHCVFTASTKEEMFVGISTFYANLSLLAWGTRLDLVELERA